MRSFDLVVIGTGTAGTTVATRCRTAGWSVAIVDELPFGGTCALRGCDPKKVLVGAGELVDWSVRMRAKGVVAGKIEIDWPALVRFKRTFTQPVPAQRQREYDDAGIVSIHGAARFVDRLRLNVGGGVLQGKHVVIASGAKPVPLRISGEEHVITSTDFLDLDRLPESIVFIGGGYISMEFAHLAARAGTKASVLDRGDRPLKDFDADLVARLVDISEACGIRIVTNTAVRGVENRGGELVVHAERDGEGVAFSTACVVHGGGRVADIDGLNLEAAGIARTRRGIAVNEYLQSRSDPAVYAAGDAADNGGLPLTPFAAAEAEIVAENLLEGNHRAVDFRVPVSIVYTVPPLAMVGLTESQARERSIAYRCTAGDSSSWYTYRRINAPSQYKMLIDDQSDQILGAHVLGSHAEELANLFTLAMTSRVPARTLKEMIFAYPTAASDLEYLLSPPEGRRP